MEWREANAERLKSTTAPGGGPIVRRSERRTGASENDGELESRRHSRTRESELRKRTEYRRQVSAKPCIGALQAAQCAGLARRFIVVRHLALESAHRGRASHRRLLFLVSATSASAAPIPGQYIVVPRDSVAAPLVAGTAALCLTNQCRGLTPQQIVQEIVADARTDDESNSGYGFQGDPRRPIGGKYCGYLIRGRECPAAAHSNNQQGA